MISRKAYYGGRPSSSSGSSKGKKSKSAARGAKPKSNVVLRGIIDGLCTGELNQSGEYQAVWVAVSRENDDSNLGRLSRMSYADLESRYGMRRASRYPEGDVEVDAARFKVECRKAAAKRRSKSA
jgi:hypothetical protein